MTFEKDTYVAYQETHGSKTFEVFGQVVHSDEITTEIEHKHGFNTIAPTSEVYPIEINKSKMTNVKMSVTFAIMLDTKKPAGERTPSAFLYSRLYHELQECYALNARELDELGNILDDCLI